MLNFFVSIYDYIAQDKILAQVVAGILVAFLSAIAAGFWWLIYLRHRRDPETRAEAFRQQVLKDFQDASEAGLRSDEALHRARCAQGQLRKIENLRGTKLAGELLNPESAISKLRSDINRLVRALETKAIEAQAHAAKAQHDAAAIERLRKMARAIAEPLKMASLIELAEAADAGPQHTVPQSTPDLRREIRILIIDMLYENKFWQLALIKSESYQLYGSVRHLIEAREMEEINRPLDGVNIVNSSLLGKSDKQEYAAKAIVRAAERSQFGDVLAILAITPEVKHPAERAITLALEENAVHEALQMIPHLNLSSTRALALLETVNHVLEDGGNAKDLVAICRETGEALAKAADEILNKPGGLSGHELIPQLCAVARAHALLGDRNASTTALELAESLVESAYHSSSRVHAKMNVAVTRFALDDQLGTEDMILAIEKEIYRKLPNQAKPDDELAVCHFVDKLLHMDTTHFDKAREHAYTWANFDRYGPLRTLVDGMSTRGFRDDVLRAFKRLPSDVGDVVAIVRLLRQCQLTSDQRIELVRLALQRLDDAPFDRMDYDMGKELMKAVGHIALCRSDPTFSGPPWPSYCQIRAAICANFVRFRRAEQFGRYCPLLLPMADDAPLPSATSPIWR